MSYAEQMLDSYPRSFSLDATLLASAIEAMQDCAQACTACADACLGEESLQDLVKCIRTDLDCADICGTTAAVMSRQTEYDANVSRALVEACAQVCKSCGAECEQHALHHEHCRVCAEAGRRCEDACRQLLAQMSA